MPGPDEDRFLNYADRAVDGTADRVLEDRYTDLDGDGVGGSGGGGVALPSPWPKRIDPALGAPAQDHPLAKAFRRVANHQDYKQLRLALVDLTDGLSKPLFVSARDAKFVFVASMAKLALLIAGFALREAVQQATKVVTVKSPDDFFAQLQKGWATEFRRFYKGTKSSGRNSPPKLKEIFDLIQPTGSFNAEFKAGIGSFWHQLGQALRAGQNQGAANCVEYLGYPYIQGALDSAGLGGDKGGIRLWKDYVSTDKNWFPGFKETGEEANLKKVAELLTLFAQDRLVRPGLQRDMLDVMAVTALHSSPGDIEQALRNKLDAVEEATVICIGKVGYLDQGRKGDAQIVRRKTASGKELHYIAIILSADDHPTVQLAARDLDEAILEAHGEKSPGP